MKKDKLQQTPQKYKGSLEITRNYASKMDNPEEMHKFLKWYNLPKINQKEIENMNRPITSTETESLKKTKKTSQNRSPGPDGFTDKFCQTFRGKS